MRAPQLTRKLVLEGPSRAADGAGGFTTVWAVLGTVWADVRAGTGRETEAAGIALSAARFRIVLRAAPQGAPSRPVPGQRFRDGARVFEILAVTEADPQGRYLTCHASEEVAT